MPAGRAGLCVNKLAPITSVSTCHTLQDCIFAFCLQIRQGLLSSLSFIHSSERTGACDPGSSADSLCRIAQSSAVLTPCAAAAAGAALQQRSAPPMLPCAWLFKKQTQAAKVKLTRTRDSSKSVHSMPYDHQPGLYVQSQQLLWPGSRLPFKPDRSCITTPLSSCRGINALCSSLVFSSVAVHARRRQEKLYQACLRSS